MLWGYKAGIIGLPKQGVAIDAVAIMDAATHDGQTFYPHVQKVFEQYPEIVHSTERVLYDSACDDAELKAQFKGELGVELKTSFNPRRSKSVTEDLPRGIEKITPYGVPICAGGYEFEYKGIRYAIGRYHSQRAIMVAGAVRKRRRYTVSCRKISKRFSPKSKRSRVRHFRRL